MRRVAGWGLLALTLAMVLGVGSASGRTATITTITVEIIGGGKVKSDPKGLDCGDDNNTGACYVAFSGSGSVDLKAVPDDGWTFDSWGASYDTDALRLRQPLHDFARRHQPRRHRELPGPFDGDEHAHGHAHRPGLHPRGRDQLR